MADLDSLSARELAVLSAVVARIVPAEPGSPGALEVGADAYIVRSLGEERVGLLEFYRGGLLDVEEAGRTGGASGFAELGPEEQDRVLESAWAGSLGGFLDVVREHVIEGMFADPRWGGNVGGRGWALLGYGGPKRVWTAAEQVVSGPGIETVVAAEPAEFLR